MSLDNIATPNYELQNITEIWGHILFWGFLMSVIIYLVVGAFFSIALPIPKKRLRLLIPFLYLGYSLVRLVFVEAITSAFIASIYVTSGWQMTTGVAIAWGLGVSLGTNLLGMLVSWVPLYSFL